MSQLTEYGNYQWKIIYHLSIKISEVAWCLWENQL